MDRGNVDLLILKSMFEPRNKIPNVFILYKKNDERRARRAAPGILVL